MDFNDHLLFLVVVVAVVVNMLLTSSDRFRRKILKDYEIVNK